MSGPKHAPWTPGPWGYGVPAKGGRAVVADANGNVVCVVEGGPLRREVTVANAQLIAAAPHLAAELAAWQQWAERWGRDIETSISISPITHNELVERLAATNAALREAGVS